MRRALPALGLTLVGTALVLRFQTAEPTPPGASGPVGSSSAGPVSTTGAGGTDDPTGDDDGASSGVTVPAGVPGDLPGGAPGDQRPGPPGDASTTPATVPATTPATVPATTAPPPGGGSSSDGGMVDGTYAGQEVMTRFGPVQVQISVQGGQIVDVQGLNYPWGDRHSMEINSWAIPQYTSEVLQAQSSDIDAMSGATITWGAFVQSTQSAIDAATA